MTARISADKCHFRFQFSFRSCKSTLDKGPSRRAAPLSTLNYKRSTRQFVPPATAGWLDKGSLDLAKLEPAIRGTPVVESYHARFFAPVLSNRIRSHI